MIDWAWALLGLIFGWACRFGWTRLEIWFGRRSRQIADWTRLGWTFDGLGWI